MATPRLEVKNVTKDFRLPHEKAGTLKQFVLNWRRLQYERHRILTNVSFSVGDGEFFGIVGRNGSGKSTLLKIMAGIYQPTSGQVKVKGTVIPFIELGVGFNGELTGRDNVFLNGAILGLTKKEIEERYEAIVGFAELAEFMDQKVKNYSSGMQVRLAFAVAIQAKSGTLLVDEVLAVGDANFQAKCFQEFRSFKKQGRTVIFVSHDMQSLLEFCDRIAVVDEGKIKSIGQPREVINDYLDIMAQSKGEEVAASHLAAGNQRWGDQQIEILKCDVDKAPGKAYVPNSRLNIKVEAEIHADAHEPNFGITIKNGKDQLVYETNTRILGIKTGDFKAGQTVQIHFAIDNVLQNGKYAISPAVAYHGVERFYDWRESLTPFLVNKRYVTGGIINVPTEIKLKKI